MRRYRKKIKRQGLICAAVFIGALAVWMSKREPEVRKALEYKGDMRESLQLGPRCTVLRVVDGDTLVVRRDGRKERVRLLYINTPERGRDGFEDAARALRSLVDRGEIRLAFEAEKSGRRDRYGRILAYVISDGRNVNVEMVRAGWTRFWTRYGRGTIADRFIRAEKEARARDTGLWNAGAWN